MRSMCLSLTVILLSSLAAEIRAGELDADELARAIDQHIQQRLDKAGIPVSPPADDAEFLRRVYLDIHGVIPSRDAAIAFLDSTDPHKRARVIDELLASPRYGTYQADIWTSVLYRIILERRYSPPRELFTQWLETAFNDNMPWDKQAHELITANGASGRNGAVAYLVHTKGVRSVEEVTNLWARVFLGRADIKCAQCHNHPFLSLRRNDYWGVAAFFSQVEVTRDSTYKGLQNGNLGLGDRLGKPADPKGDVPDGFRLLPPRFLEGDEPSVDEPVPYRRLFADWVTSPKNPYFARAMVNRTWAQFFGKGLINPIDEMHEENPATHPALLALMADQFAANGFDIKYLMRAITNSQTYQRSSRTLSGNSEDDELYTHMPVKVLMPRQLFDSLERISGQSEGSRKGARDNFINSFGTLDSTDGELPDPTEYNRNLAQQLRLMTSIPPFQNIVGNLLKQTAQPGTPAQEVIENLYLTVLSRRPGPQEMARALAFIDDRGAAGYSELARVLLTTSEFALNH